MELGRGTLDMDTGAAQAAGLLNLAGGVARPAAAGDIPAIELLTADGAGWLAQPLGYHSEDEQFMAAYAWEQLTAALIGGDWPPDAESEMDGSDGDGAELDEDREVRVVV